MELEEKIKKITTVAEGRQHDLTMLKLAAGATLVVDKSGNELRLLNRKQELQLTITIKEEGLVINASAQQLNLHATDQLNLSANKINIDASSEINLRSGGTLYQEVQKDATVVVGGTSRNTAEEQVIYARLGDVDIKANDDIKLDGERVLLNCD